MTIDAPLGAAPVSLTRWAKVLRIPRIWHCTNRICCYAGLFLRERIMACRFGFIVAILTASLAVPSAKAQAGGEPGGIWLTQAGGAGGRRSKICAGDLAGVVWAVTASTTPTA